MNRFLVALCLLGLSSCFAKFPVVVNDHDLQEDSNTKQILDDVMNVRPSYHADGGLGFSWSNCGDQAKDPIQVKALSVSPDPIVIPGNVNLSADAVVTHDIEAATSVALVVKKKLFGVFIEVPCIDNLGSCTYQNPCALLEKVQCPPVLEKYGINCRCPIKKNEYKIPAISVAIPEIKLPSFIENGDYEIQATLMNGAERLACYDIKASLQTK